MKLTLLVGTLLLVASAAFGQVMMKGDFSANVNSEGWTLNGGSGNRIHMVFVKFPKAFAKEPMVTVSLTSYDGAPGKDGNVRVGIKADQITREGFTVKVTTWGDSRVAGIEGNWFAFTNK
jgi:hypothetical protein